MEIKNQPPCNLRVKLFASVAVSSAIACLMLGGNAAQAQVVNFDTRGLASFGYGAYVGQGAYSDPGHNYWNTMVQNGTTPAATNSDGVTVSAITLSDTSPSTYNGGNGAGTQGTPRGLISGFFLENNGTVRTETLHNVPAGTYNLFLYGANAGQDRGVIFTALVGATSYGTNSTVNLNAFAPENYNNDTAFIAGTNYVEFTNLVVGAGSTITFTYTANNTINRPTGLANQDYSGANGEGDFDGLQLVTVSSSVTVATVTNSSATAIQSTSATVGGGVVSTGGSVPTVIIYYGPNNGGTNASGWSNSVSVGFSSGIFNQGISNLSPTTLYYFTAAAVNSAGTNWAIPSLSFTTAAAQVVNFDSAGMAGGGGVNYSGQGAYADSGHNYWNPLVFDGTTAAGTNSDGVTANPITLRDASPIRYNPGQGSQGTIAGFEAPYVENDDNGSIVTNTLNGVPAGTYNLLLYGKNDDVGDADRGTTFTVSSGTTSYGTQSTVNGVTNVFTQGNDYVQFTNVAVGIAGTLTFTYTANAAANAHHNPQLEGDFNGLQLVYLSSSTFSLATVTNSSVTGIQTTSATLGGGVVSTGGSVPAVTIYYGLADGGTNAAAWSNSVSAGFTSGAFSNAVSNLSPATVYYFTAATMNGAGTNWATPSQSFITPAAGSSQVVNFDVPGGMGGLNYSGQGALPDSGHNYWNAFVNLGTTSTGFFSDGVTASPITLTDTSPGHFGPQGAQGTVAGLEGPFVENNNAGSTITNTINNVPAGTYNLFLYGKNDDIGDADRGTSFTVLVGTNSYGTQSTVNSVTSSFTQGNDYVEFAGLTVGAAGTITFAYTANTAAIAHHNPQQEGDFNGLQLVSTSLSTTLASVTNSSATSIQAASAILGGAVLSTGGYTPNVTIYYGTSDGGTNIAAWSNSVSLGFENGSFSQMVSNISPATIYYFTAAVANGSGTVWATPSQSFATTAATLAQVTNLPAANITANTATLAANVLNTGGSTTVVTMFYGTNDGGANAVNWSNSINLGVLFGHGAQTVANLSSNTTYYFAAQASNNTGVAWGIPSGSFTTLATNPVSTLVAMLTYHNDNTRWGVNTNETSLTLANVNTNTFGKLFSYAVDGYVYAQPLVMTNVVVPNLGLHNVLYVATENDTLYAFDADSNSGANAVSLWQTNLIPTGETAVPSADVYPAGQLLDVTPAIGITSTPVIDPVTGTIYVETKTKAVISGQNHYIHRLHALDIGTGAEKFGGPAVIAETIYQNGNYTYVSGPTVPGTGDDSVGGVVYFNALRHMNRMALGLLNGTVYLGFASHEDNRPYHGWFLGYNATNLSQMVSVFNSTPNGGLGGFWSGGGTFTADSSNNLYLMTGNGDFNATTGTVSPTNNYGMSVLKLATTNNTTTLVDYFTMYDWATENGGDRDLGSGAAIVLPDSVGSASHTHLLLAAGKQGNVYLLDRDSMGHFNAANDSQIVQEMDGAIGSNDGTPAFWNNTIYYLGLDDNLKAFSISNAVIASNPTRSTHNFGGDKNSSTPSISSAGTSNGIVWAIDASAYSSSGAETLYAFNATNIALELYDSSLLSSRDNPGAAVKFIAPTVANGKVYVGAEYAISVFGVASFVPVPTITPNGGIYTNSVTVTLSDTASSASIYYTLDGSTPTGGSTLYTGSFTLTNSAIVHAIATAPGLVNSGVASASFINSSAIGNGTGLLGAYYSNHTSVNPYTGSPTLVRTDAVMNFNWNTTGPDPSVGQTNFTVRWTGSVQPQFNETYTFYATADDGVRLWVNGQQLINQWQDEGVTTYQGTITLKAQQLYNIEMDYYQNGGGAVAELQWSSPSTARAVIPQTQLYPYTNPPPTIVLSSPTNGSTYTATASVTIGAVADAPYNPISRVDFYTNNILLGTLSNSPYAPLYTLTTTGLNPGSYALTAVATDGSGLSNTSSVPVNITVASSSGQPYGLTTRGTIPAFFNMPTTFAGSLPPLLSQTGVFSNMPSMTPTNGLILYQPNVPLWSDGALKIRYMAVPDNGGVITPDQQIAFAPTGTWTFPNGTIFVKTFELQTNETDPNSILRLETRLLVRDINGAVYGVTYKWRPDNSDADLLTTSLTQDVPITTATGMRTQTWYYPSPADCLTCHTAVANYVLGVNTRQLNGSLTYPATGTTDNQLRTLNRLGLFNPAFDESTITNFEKLSALTNLTASLQDRARSYLDANCAQCHQPGGTGPTFDARYETPLASQNITNVPAVKGNLGADNAMIVMPKDIWRSVLYGRMNTTNNSVKMPPLARNLIDTNAVQVFADWINSLPGIAALAPPTITPNGGTFLPSVSVALQSTNNNAMLYYTLDGSLPTTNSLLYSAPFALTANATVMASAFETNFNNSVSASGLFLVQPLHFTSSAFLGNGQFQLGFAGMVSSNYVLQATTNFINWTPISTNTAMTNFFNLFDPKATNFPYRFYRVLQQ